MLIEWLINKQMWKLRGNIIKKIFVDLHIEIFQVDKNHVNLLVVTHIEIWAGLIFQLTYNVQNIKVQKEKNWNLWWMWTMRTILKFLKGKFRKWNTQIEKWLVVASLNKMLLIVQVELKVTNIFSHAEWEYSLFPVIF